MKQSLYILLIICTLGVNAQTYPIGHLSLATIDSARSNRNVTAEVYYPGTIAGNDVPVSNGQFPLVVFGHGFLMQHSVYNNIWEELVPNGYICVLLTTEGGISPNHTEMGTDFIFIKNTIQADAASNANSVFYQKLTTTSAYMGHSMGGGASYLAAANDPTVTALVGLAPAVTNPSSINAAAMVNKPAIIFSGSADPVTPPETAHIPIYDSLKSDCKVFVSITGGGHCYFANSGSVCEFGEGGANFTITRDQQHAITNSLLTPWLNYWLKNDVAALSTFNNILQTDQGITHNQHCNLLTTGTKDATFARISIYPNPTTGKVFINLPNSSYTNIKLIDMNGRVVRNERAISSVEEIDLKGLACGLYLLQVTNPLGTYNYKVIKE